MVGKNYFSIALSDRQQSLLGALQKKQIVFEAETFSAVIAMRLWQKPMHGSKCFLFVDNEGAKFSFLKGRNDNETVERLAEFFVSCEAKMQNCTWISRVPSKNIIADAPSRGTTPSWLLMVMLV